MKLQTYKVKPYFCALFLLLGGSFIALMIVSCATIVSGTSQKINIGTVPYGAKVIVNDVYKGTTPAIIEFNRKDPYITLRFEKDGYKPVEVELLRDVNYWIFGNIFGIIGLAIDFASSAAYKLEPSEVNILLTELEKKGMNNYHYLRKDIIVAIDLQSINKFHFEKLGYSNDR